MMDDHLQPNQVLAKTYPIIQVEDVLLAGFIEPTYKRKRMKSTYNIAQIGLVDFRSLWPVLCLGFQQSYGAPEEGVQSRENVSKLCYFGLIKTRCCSKARMVMSKMVSGKNQVFRWK